MRRAKTSWPFALITISVFGCAPRPVDRRNPSSEPPVQRAVGNLSLSPNPVSLGRLKPGQTARTDVVLKNSGREQRDVSRIETSCPCVQLTPFSARLGPGMSTNLEVKFDPSSESNFRGSLAVRVTGIDAEGVEQFQGTVEVTVVEEVH
jgi:hypothetical protein